MQHVCVVSTRIKKTIKNESECASTFGSIVLMGPNLTTRDYPSTVVGAQSIRKSTDRQTKSYTRAYTTAVESV